MRSINESGFKKDRWNLGVDGEILTYDRELYLTLKSYDCVTIYSINANRFQM
jgi:hypothetical protein